MSAITIKLEEDLAALLHELNRPAAQLVREFIVLELYRRGSISSGKAAELLGMPRGEFVRYASRLGIAMFDMTEDEWQTERSHVEKM